MVALLKNENFKCLDTEKEKFKEFFEIYCADCNDAEDIIERNNEFKIVQKREKGTSRNKDNKFYKTNGFVYERVGFFIE